MLSDLQLAFRALLKARSFTLVSLVIFGMGVGLNTTIFSLLNTLLFQPLPYHDDARLFRVHRTTATGNSWPHSAADFYDFRASSRQFAKLAAVEWRGFNLSLPGAGAERVAGQRVSEDFFAALGVAPLVGRTLTEEEIAARREDVVVLGERLWQSHFGRDPSIVGRMIRLDGRAVEVVGVMPAEFAYPLLWGRVELWTPLVLTTAERQDRAIHWLAVLGRLAPGSTLSAAQAELSSLAERVAEQHPATNRGDGVRLVPLRDSALDDLGRQLAWLVAGLAFAVLLIACANLSILQVARGTAGLREFAIRAALGASRGRLVRQILAEGLVLAFGGGALGFLTAVWITGPLGEAIKAGDFPGLRIDFDGRVLSFTLITATVAALLSGLWPALSFSRPRVTDALNDGTPGSTRGGSKLSGQHTLIILQIALALALLSGALFCLRGLKDFLARDTGWRTDQVLTASLVLPTAGYPDESARRLFAERLRDRLASWPGTESVGLGSSLPFYGLGRSVNLRVEGHAMAPNYPGPLAYEASVDSGYFRALAITVLEGKVFSDRLLATDPGEIVINETMARALWPGRSAVGRRLRPTFGNEGWLTVVAVVRDLHFASSLGRPETPFQVYRPLVQAPVAHLSLAVVTRAAPERLGPELRRLVARIDPDVSLQHVGSVRSRIDYDLSNFRLVNVLLVAMALLGVLLAALGLYGLVSAYVARRTREIGIRIALGASAARVLRSILAQGLRLAVLGAGLGLLASAGLLRLLEAIVPAFATGVALPLAIAALLMIAAAAAAAWLPARRAMRINPVEALRTD